MIVIETVQERPSTSIPWYLEMDPVLAGQVQEVVMNFQQFAEPPVVSILDGGLKHVSVAKYNTLADLDAFFSALAQVAPMFFRDRQLYSEENGITVTRTITNE